MTEAQQELDDIFAWQESRTVSNSLTLQYDKVVFLLDPTEKARSLIRKKVMIFDYPDGTITIKHCGMDLSFTIFDKLQEVNQAEIVENKRLGAALAFAKKNQEERKETRERKRSSNAASRKAQLRAQRSPKSLNPSVTRYVPSN